MVARIRDIAAGPACVGKLDEVLTMRMSPEFILVNISVDFRDGLETGEVEQASSHLDRTSKDRYGIVKTHFHLHRHRSVREDQGKPWHNA